MRTGQLHGDKGVYTLKHKLGLSGVGQSWVASVDKILKHNKWLVKPGPKVGDKVVIKWANLQPGFSPADNHAFLQEVNASINLELSVLKQLASLACVAKIYDFGHVSMILPDGSSEGAFFLVEEFLEGVDFEEYLKDRFGHSSNKDERVFTGISEPQDFFKLALQLTSALRTVHQQGVIHGDIWQNNIKVSENGELRLFDFGSSTIRYTTFLHPDILARRRTDSYVAPERRHGERHGRRSDIYSIGGLFYYMCIGHDPPFAEPDIDKHKDAIVNALRRYNPSLLTANYGIADIIARCMRYDKDQRIPDTDTLLDELRTFSFAGIAFTSEDDPSQRCVSCLLGANGASELFSRMLRMDCTKLRSQAEDMQRGIFELSGDHEYLVLGMCTYLSVLGKNDTFLVRATPRFWTSRNMGINGRFLSMVRLISQRGVVVKHLMLVSDCDRDDAETRRILEAHLTAANMNTGLENGYLKFFCKSVSAKDRTHLMNEQGWETCYAITGDEVMAVQPVYDRNDVLRTVRFIHDDAATVDSRIKKIEKEISSAITLEDWLRQS
jgi:serine/threonine protein kinase